MKELTKEDYIQRLKTQDWWYERSDNYGIWQKGYNAIRTLRQLRKAFDPDHLIWNKYAPAHFKIEQK
jgi:FAD/FMN-containing dehydrogenase